MRACIKIGIIARIEPDSADMSSEKSATSKYASCPPTIIALV